MYIKPFRGLLPDNKLVSNIVSPPYDVVSREEVRKIIKSNVYSFLRITRADAEFDNNVDEHSEVVYKRAKENLDNFLKEKILFKDEKENFYLLSQTFNGKTQNGFYTLLRCEDYKNALIKRHELTRKDKEEDRTNHIMTTKADTGPVFLFFKRKEGFSHLVNEIKTRKADYSFTDENGVLNELWKVDSVENVMKFFDGIDCFYIADGHHRAASAINVWEKMGRPKNSPYSYFFGVVFSSDELSIYPYNRLVKDLNGLTKEIFIQKIKEHFNITKGKVSELKKGEIGVYLEGEDFVINFKNSGMLKTPIDRLDVSILQKYLLEPILDIKDPRTSDRISFIGGRNAIEIQKGLVDSGKAKIAFFLHPVDINELIEISDRGEIMPPKSTWFEPKLKDGLVTYLLD